MLLITEGLAVGGVAKHVVSNSLAQLINTSMLLITEGLVVVTL